MSFCTSGKRFVSSEQVADVAEVHYLRQQSAAEASRDVSEIPLA